MTSSHSDLGVSDTEATKDRVRQRYADAARAVSQGAAAACCEPEAPSCCPPTAAALQPADWFGSGLYDATETAGLPDDALLASLGCGNPLAVADLQAGGRVLDLGSGGGIDVLLSARRVGPTGRAYGVDMTPEMLELARRNVGCIAGALSREEYLAGLTAVGFVEPSVEFTHEAAPGMHGAIIRANKPTR